MDTLARKSHSRSYQLPRLPSSALPHPPPTIPLPLLNIAPPKTSSPYPLNPRICLEPAKNQRVIDIVQRSYTSKSQRHSEDKKPSSKYASYMDHDFSTLIGLFPRPPSYLHHHATTRSPIYHRSPLTPGPRSLSINNTATSKVELEQTLSELDDSDDEFTCLPDPTLSDTCPWEQELNPTNLSSQDRKRLTAMNRAFDVVNQYEWITKNLSYIDADSLANLYEASDPNNGPDDRSPDVASLSLPPISVESHAFLSSPKANAQNPEPTPHQYLTFECSNLPDEILADDERYDEIDPQQPRNLKRALSRKKSIHKNTAKDDHPLTRSCPLRSSCNVLRPQGVKESVSSKTSSRVQSLINLFEKPILVKSSESFGSSDSAYESGTITIDIAMLSCNGKNGIRDIVDSNNAIKMTPSSLVKTSPNNERTLQGNLNSVVQLQPLNITPNTALKQLRTVFDPTTNIALNHKNSNLGILAATAISHKFYWTPTNTQEIRDLDLFQSSYLVSSYLHQSEIGHYGYQSTVPRLGSLPKMKALKDGDDDSLTKLDVSSYYADCGRCSAPSRPCQQHRLHQVPDPTPRPPPRPRPRPSPRPMPDAPPAANLSFGSDSFYDSMSESDSNSDTVLKDVFEFFDHIESVDFSPASSVIPLLSREQVLHITAKAQRLEAAIRALLVQLDDFLVQKQASEVYSIESESGFPKRLVDDDDDNDVTEHPGAPRKPPLRPTTGGPFPATSPLPPPRGTPAPRPPRCAGLNVSTMEDTPFSDILMVKGVNTDQSVPQFCMPVLSNNPQEPARAEDIPVLSKAGANSGSSAVNPGMGHTWVSIERSSCHEQSRVLCQAIVSHMLQLH
ncbi:hypothetical protein BGZ81_011197 [Podila clonocystis]|nr:hypothetical protein BGZ81_011197 [Podila clonocystis]